MSQENYQRHAPNRSNPALPELHICPQKIPANYLTDRQDQFPICPATATPKQQMNKSLALTPFLPVQLQWETLARANNLPWRLLSVQSDFLCLYPIFRLLIDIPITTMLLLTTLLLTTSAWAQ